MIGKATLLLSIVLTAANMALPLTAQAKTAADPGAQVCELEWNASFGRVALTQRVSGSGVVVSDFLSVARPVPGNNGLGASLTMSETGAQREFTLRLGGPLQKGKNLRLVFAVPGGAPLVAEAEQGASLVTLSPAQFAYLLSAPGAVTYRLVRQDRKGRERAELAAGQIDLSQFAGQELAGLAEAARLSRAVLTQARGTDNPPCAMAWAADMNAAYSSEPARKWLTFDCGEEWSGPAGAFGLQPTAFVWRPRPRDGVELKFSASMQAVPQSDRQHFIDNRDDRSRFGTISVHFPANAWRMNFRGNDRTAWERQSGQLSRGGGQIGKPLTQAGDAGFFWSEFAQLMVGQGDLAISAQDSIDGKRFDTVLPWSEVIAAETELRAGLDRLRLRERDPLARCKAQVQEESGMEEEIVT